jgi:hypothetical protein
MALRALHLNPLRRAFFQGKLIFEENHVLGHRPQQLMTFQDFAADAQQGRGFATARYRETIFTVEKKAFFSGV